MTRRKAIHLIVDYTNGGHGSSLCNYDMPLDILDPLCTTEPNLVTCKNCLRSIKPNPMRHITGIPVKHPHPLKGIILVDRVDGRLNMVRHIIAMGHSV